MKKVEKVKADAETKTAEITYTEPATEERIIRALEVINYPIFA